MFLVCIKRLEESLSNGEKKPKSLPKMNLDFCKSKGKGVRVFSLFTNTSCTADFQANIINGQPLIENLQ